MQLSLLNFNTLGTPFFAPFITKRYQAFAKIINENPLDILCLQEVATYYHLSLLRKYLQGFPFVAYEKQLYGPQGGVVIFSKIPFEKIYFQSFSALGSFKNLSFYTRLLRNGMLIVKLKNLPFTLMTTHLVSDFEFDESPTNHLYPYVKNQVEEVIQQVNNISKDNTSILVTGDFNLKKHSKLYKTLLQKTKVTDVFPEKFPTYYRERLDYKFKGKTSERIDFVFIKEREKNIRVLAHSYLFDKKEQISNKKLNYLSDHIGLKINFDIV
ncbi:MAG TPA: endonuclease/exonuclease/phosphatase family protein [Methylomirabilota bacterium]|nr:endonuclease/exonuclease/phosphatase family protein [Methylomirabilota bacterium]